jgi:hypothetical protein
MGLVDYCRTNCFVLGVDLDDLKVVDHPVVEDLIFTSLEACFIFSLDDHQQIIVKLEQDLCFTFNLEH